MNVRNKVRQAIASVTLMVFTSYGAYGQSAGDSEFEVASVKRNTSGDRRSSTHTSKGEVIMRNVPLKQCIERAYDVKDYALSGPDWLTSERYDIVAKPPSNTPVEQLQLMLRTLLAERFKLKVHRESKVVSSYALVVGKNGPKLQQVEASGGGSHMNSGRGQLTAQKVSMSQLADFLARQLDRPVVDRTECKGVFDLKLEWTEESHSTDGASGPSIFTAVQEQLGLRLQAQKLPVEILVVDNVEKVPTEN